MNQINDLTERLGQAGDLPFALAAAYRAFDAIRLAIRGREDPASGMFAAFVMSAAAAIDGRDAVARAPSLPLSCLSPGGTASHPWSSSPGAQRLATGLAALAGALAERLATAGHAARLAGDRDACAQAVACAREIHGLLAGVTS